MKISFSGAVKWAPAVVMVSLLLGPLSASAATLNVTTNAVAQTDSTNVINVANRLLTLQNANGGWDWVVTGATGPSANTYYNVTGVTGSSLLDAYTLTGNTAYLTAAENAGTYIINSATSATSTGNATTGRQNGYNLSFLNRLAQVSGNTTYSDEANSIFNTVTTADNFFDHNLGSFCGASASSTGCTPEELMSAFENYRSSNSTPNGVVLWDMEPWVEAAVSAGNTAFATELASDMDAYVSDPSYTSSVDSYALGLASVVRAEIAANGTASSTVVAALDAAQNGDGSFGTAADGQVQSTAYAMYALDALQDSTRAAAAATFLNNNIYTDHWIETGGTDEYAENDSEAARALAFGLPSNTYYTIQSAVNAAQPGDTVMVPAGTYNGFSISGKSGITIQGAGVGSTIINPTSLIATGLTHKYTAGVNTVVFVATSTNVSLNGLTIDSTNQTPGAGGPDAIVFWDASTGSINNAAVTGTYTISGAQTGQGIAVDASGTQTSTLAVNNTAISGFQKNGIEAIDGNGTTSGSTDTITVTVNGGSITGAGSTGAIAQNGIVIWNRGGGTVTGSAKNTTISGFDYSGPDTAAGVLAYGGGNVTTISNSTLTNNQLNIQTTAGSPDINATDNYWGSASGPDLSTLDSTSTVSYSPWYTDAAMTNLMFTTVASTTASTTSTTVGSSDVDESATSTSEGTGTTTVSIPAGTTITGNSSWDGTIQALTVVPVTTVTVTPAANTTASVVEEIEVGNPTQKLILSHAAEIVFPGQAGNSVGWSLNGTFTPITTICSGNDQATEDANLAAGADCVETSGSDLVVWTKHFTTFATYTQTAVTTSSSSGGGGGGGGGGIISVTGDINGDGKVNLSDFTELLAAWGATGSNLAADLNHDGKVDILDFNVLLANWTR